MTKINLNKIVTPKEYKEKINEDNFEILSAISNSIDKKFTYYNNTYAYLDRTSRDVARLKYPDHSFEEKEFISTSIMFTDTNIIQILLDLKISYNKLSALCTNLSIYKKHYNNSNDFIFKSVNFLKTEAIFIKICNYICKNYNCHDFYLAANKLTYIVAFQENLYKELENQKIKKIQ